MDKHHDVHLVFFRNIVMLTMVKFTKKTVKKEREKKPLLAFAKEGTIPKPFIEDL